MHGKNLNTSQSFYYKNNIVQILVKYYGPVVGLQLV